MVITSLMDRLDLEMPPQFDVFIVKLSPELSFAARIDQVTAVVVPCSNLCLIDTVAPFCENPPVVANAICIAFVLSDLHRYRTAKTESPSVV